MCKRVLCVSYMVLGRPKKWSHFGLYVVVILIHILCVPYISHYRLLILILFRNCPPISESSHMSQKCLFQWQFLLFGKHFFVWNFVAMATTVAYNDCNVISEVQTCLARVHLKFRAPWCAPHHSFTTHVVMPFNKIQLSSSPVKLSWCKKILVVPED